MNSMDNYLNRQEAGKILANNLINYSNSPNTIVLALPRGGVPVAFEVAQSLSLPLDVYIVRKLGVPGHEELALGALAPNRTIVYNEDIVNSLHISDDRIAQTIKNEEHELLRREKAYRGNNPPLYLKDKTIILI